MNGDLMVIKPLVMEYQYMTDWWFGTMEFSDFPFSWEWKIIPTDEFSIIFQRGGEKPPTSWDWKIIPTDEFSIIFQRVRYTNHQPATDWSPRG